MIMIFVLIIFSATAYLLYNDYSKTRSMSALDKMMSIGAVVIDVRPAVEYSKEHINGSINIPFVDLVEQGINYSHDSQIIVCCADGTYSQKAAQSLRNSGFINVYNCGGWKNLANTIGGSIVHGNNRMVYEK